MTFDIAIYGSGISSKIAAIGLAKHDYSVCLISDQIGDYQNKTPSNLVTFLSHGSLGYLQTILSEIKFSFLNLYCTMYSVTPETGCH